MAFSEYIRKLENKGHSHDHIYELKRMEDNTSFNWVFSLKRLYGTNGLSIATLDTISNNKNFYVYNRVTKEKIKLHKFFKDTKVEYVYKLP